MAQDVRKCAAAHRTIQAMEFQAERMRQKINDCSPDPHDILGAAVENHHKSKSLLTSALLRTQEAYESRSSIIFREVDDFEVDDDEDREGSLLSSKGLIQQPATPDQPERNDSSTALGSALGSNSLSAKKAAQDVDPATLLRRMRSSHTARSLSVRTLEASRPSHTLRAESDAAEDCDDGSIFKEMASLRGRSFLSRPDQGAGGAADGMLAQIRGPRWGAEHNSASKSFKSMSIRVSETPQSPLVTRTDSASLASATAVPGAGAKSFTAGKRSSALPGVSVDTAPSLMEKNGSPLGASPSQSGRQAQPASSGGGLFSKLKQMVRA